MGEPVRVSVCHCLECQKRSGSAFAVQARWPVEQVTLTGAWTEWSRTGESGAVATYRFCATCGSTVTYVNGHMPGVVAVPVGAFADPAFPAPGYSVWQERMHAWVTVGGESVEHMD